MINGENLGQVLKVLPEGLINRIKARGSEDRRRKWGYGDDVMDVYNQFVALSMPHNLLDAAWVVHVLSDGERAQNTLKGYGQVARFFPESVREHFHHLDLPFQHFVYAASVEGVDSETGKPRWQLVLEYSWAKYIGNGGKPTSENDLRGKFTPGRALIPEHISAPIVLNYVDSDEGPIRVEAGSFPVVYADEFVERDMPAQAKDERLTQALHRMAALADEMKSLLPVFEGHMPGFAKAVAGFILTISSVFDSNLDGRSEPVSDIFLED
jgi:hypothetical protein